MIMWKLQRSSTAVSKNLAKAKKQAAKNGSAVALKHVEGEINQVIKKQGLALQQYTQNALDEALKRKDALIRAHSDRADQLAVRCEELTKQVKHLLAE